MVFIDFLLVIGYLAGQTTKNVLVLVNCFYASRKVGFKPTPKLL